MNISERQSKRLLRVNDVARILNISSSSVYRMVEKRLVTFYKLRSGLRFKEKDIEQYVQDCRTEAIR